MYMYTLPEKYPAIFKSSAGRVSTDIGRVRKHNLGFPHMRTPGHVDVSFARDVWRWAVLRSVQPKGIATRRCNSDDQPQGGRGRPSNDR